MKSSFIPSRVPVLALAKRTSSHPKLRARSIVRRPFILRLRERRWSWVRFEREMVVRLDGTVLFIREVESVYVTRKKKKRKGLTCEDV